MPTTPLRYLCISLLLSLVIALVYIPGLKGPWLLDDEPNIFKNEQVQLSELTPGQLKIAATAPLASYSYARGLAYLSFALNYYFSGQEFSPYAFKLTNLIIHGINALLVYWIVFIICAAAQKPSRLNPHLLAGLIALCWACHPIQVSSVLYAVQRMTLVSGTSVLLGCLLFLRYRISPGYLTLDPRRTAGLITALGLCMIIGFHFKETAVLLPVYLLALELIVRPFHPSNIKLDRLLIVLTVVTGITALGYLMMTVGDIRSQYIYRNFTLEDRLLTQPRVLFWYLKLIWLPQLSDYSLFLDNYPLSHSLLQPATTLFSLLGWAALITVSLLSKMRWLLVACLVWYLGGHLMESTFLHLEIAFEHRNYLPALAPIALAIAGFSWLSNAIPSRSLIRYLPLALPLVLLPLLTTVRSTYWGDKVMFITQQVDNRPHSVRANGAAGLFYATRDPVLALEHFATAAKYNDEAILPVVSQYSILMTAYNLYDRAEQADPTRKFDVTAGIREQWSKADLADEITRLEADIERRLAAYSISAQVMGSLEKITYCALAKRPACKDPALALKWVNIALNNEKKLKRHTPLLSFHKARLLAATGHQEEAVELMEKIINDFPDNDYYKIKLAELYDTLGMTDKFREILRPISLELIEKYIPASSMEYVRSILEQ